MRPLSVQFLPFHACFSKIFPNNRFLAQTQGLAPPVWEIQDSPLLASASVHRRFKPIIYTFFLYVGPSMHKFDHKQHRRLHMQEKVHCFKQIVEAFCSGSVTGFAGGGAFHRGSVTPMFPCVTNSMISDPVQHYEGPSWVNVLICLYSSDLLNTTTSTVIYHLSCCTV